MALTFLTDQEDLGCRPAGQATPTPAPWRADHSPCSGLELQAIPEAHALGGHTGQPLSVQCLAPSRLHSHVKNAREQAGDLSLEGDRGCGGGSWPGSQQDPAIPQYKAQNGGWAAGDVEGGQGLAGVGTGV